MDAVDWYLFAKDNNFEDLRNSCWAFLEYNSSEVRHYVFFCSCAVPYIQQDKLVTITVHIEAEDASRKKASLSNEDSLLIFSFDMLDVM